LSTLVEEGGEQREVRSDHQAGSVLQRGSVLIHRETNRVSVPWKLNERLSVRITKRKAGRKRRKRRRKRKKRSKRSTSALVSGEYEEALAKTNSRLPELVQSKV